MAIKAPVELKKKTYLQINDFDAMNLLRGQDCSANFYFYFAMHT